MDFCCRTNYVNPSIHLKQPTFSTYPTTWPPATITAIADKAMKPLVQRQP